MIPARSIPTIDANKVIHITFPPAASGNGPVTAPGKGSEGSVHAYLTAASTALRGGKPLQRPDPAKLEKFSQCMRANGVPAFPDPSGGGIQIQSGGPGGSNMASAPTAQPSRTLPKRVPRRLACQGLGAGRRRPGPSRPTAGWDRKVAPVATVELASRVVR